MTEENEIILTLDWEIAELLYELRKSLSILYSIIIIMLMLLTVIEVLVYYVHRLDLVSFLIVIIAMLGLTFSFEIKNTRDIIDYLESGFGWRNYIKKLRGENNES